MTFAVCDLIGGAVASGSRVQVRGWLTVLGDGRQYVADDEALEGGCQIEVRQSRLLEILERFVPAATVGSSVLYHVRSLLDATYFDSDGGAFVRVHGGIAFDSLEDEWPFVVD